MISGAVPRFLLNQKKKYQFGPQGKIVKISENMLV